MDATLDVRLILLALPEHKDENTGPPVKVGEGLTVSIAWNIAPAQPAAEIGVIE